jgi:hypothetical protein
MVTRTIRMASVVAAGFLLFGAAPSPAQEDASRGRRIDVHANLSWFLGAGARAELPIVPQGFVPRLDDELALAPGVEVFALYWRHYPDLFYEHDGDVHHDVSFAAAPLVAAQWNLYLHPRWSVFPEVGVALVLERYGLVFPETVLAVGGRFHFNRMTALFGRVGWPFGLQLGVTF